MTHPDDTAQEATMTTPEFQADDRIDITIKNARVTDQHRLGFLKYEADGIEHEVMPGGSITVAPAMSTSGPTFESLTSDLDAIVKTVPDMDRDELIDLREALNMVVEAIEKERGERDWVTRNEH